MTAGAARPAAVRLARGLVLGACLAAPLAAAHAQAAAAGGARAPRQARASEATAAAAVPVQMGTVVRPDTVTVGDPFVLTVRLRVPRGARVTLPEGPDSGATVEALDPRRVSTSADSTELTVAYRLAAWDVGTVPLAMPAALVRLGDVERVVPFGDLTVTVKSVLPADSAQRVPRPPRPPLETTRSLWWLWLLAALAAALVGWLIWRWLRRRREAEPEPVVDAYDFAEREFERVERLGLVEAGERGRYVALVVDVLRDYLARRLDSAPASLTSTELLARLQGERRVNAARLAPVLAESDLVKFARRPVSPERARALGAEARAIVREVNAAWAAQAARAAAEPPRDVAA